MTIKVIVSDPIFEEGIKLLEEQGYQVTKAWDLPKSELPEIIGDYDALVVRSATKVTADLLAKAKRLKVVGRAGDGTDNVDVQKAHDLGIAVVNTPHIASKSVAELAIGFILATARGIVDGTISLREGKWAKEEFMGMEVNGKTLGIIGCGSIGREVKQLARCLGMNVIIVDICVSDEFVPLDKMLPQADFITIHVPLTPHTKHLLSTKEFAEMKDGVVLVNCSRGGIVDEEALYQALVSGKAKAAALDVFEQEPPKNNKLFTLKNVYGTPHIGAQTYEAQRRTSEQIARKVIEALAEAETKIDG
ncbi:MAG TPA: hydroxyacid dehydrogenase [Candidatus Nanoarchaeia archaeon]|nr:hydroxyacid dehydrogenase [Candidatus Nanoarchaeia archaeon]